jgi:hypothetical protein
VLAAPVLIYFFILRPRLQVGFAAFYKSLDDLEANSWQRIKSFAWRFRTFLIGTGGIVVSMVPDLLQMVGALDWESLLPERWKGWSGVMTIIVMMASRAYSATAGTTPPDGEDPPEDESKPAEEPAS